MTEQLYLHEEVLLLALRDEEGTIEMGSMFQMAVAGAILAELVLGERLTLAKHKRKEVMRPVSSDPFDDEILNDALEMVHRAKREEKAQTWVTKFSQIKDLKHRIARGLCRKGVLREDEDKILLIFKRTIYPERDPTPEREIIGRLERAIFRGTDVDDRTRTLLALAHHAGLLGNAFEKTRLKRAKDRIESLCRGGISGDATKAAIEATQAAIIAGITAATAATVITS